MARDPAASRPGRPGEGDQAGGGQAGWGAEKTAGEAFFRKWSTVLRSWRQQGVRRQQKPEAGGGSAQQIPSRSGPAATVTGCTLLKCAFHGRRQPRPAGPRPPPSPGASTAWATGPAPLFHAPSSRQAQHSPSPQRPPHAGWSVGQVPTEALGSGGRGTESPGCTRPAASEGRGATTMLK